MTSKEISVAAHNHVVTLSGFAHGYTEKVPAKRVAKRVFGVIDVLDHLEVKPGIIKTDPELAPEAMQSL